MGHRPDEANGGASRQARVRVESDHVSDPHWHVQLGPQERRAIVPQEQLVELLELAALALPTHPLALAGIPDPVPVEQEESGPRVGSGTMAPVEPADPLDGGLEQPIISRHGFRRRVDPVGEESEVDGALQIGKIVELQAIDLLLDLGVAHQQGRHHHEGSQVGRDALGEPEAWQRSGAEQLRDDAIDERDGEIGCRNQGGESEQNDHNRSHTRRMRGDEGNHYEQPRDGADGAQVTRRGSAHVGSQQPLRKGYPVAELPFEAAAPFRDQVVTGILGPGSGRGALAPAPARPGSPERSPPGRPRGPSAGSRERGPRSRDGTGRASRSPSRRSCSRPAARRRPG